MGYDVTADWFFGVSCREHRAAVDLCYNLISDDNSDTEFIRHPLQVSQELSKAHLTGTQFTSA